MFAKLVSPECLVGCSLIDPILVHISQQVVLAECFDEGVDAWAGVGRNDGSIGEPIGSIRRWRGVELTAEIAILSIGSVAEVRPETVQSPSFGWYQLTFAFESRVSIPELRL